MPHTCKAIGCNSNVFGGDYCKYHQYIRRMKGGDLFKRKENKPAKAIPKQSEKRKVEAKTYLQIRREMYDEAEANGTNKCFFCDDWIFPRENLHHTKGRDGKNFIDIRWLVLAHQKCHVDKYHHLSIENLIKETWYQGFLTRLKALDPHLYAKELKKQEKGLLFMDENLE